MMLYKVNDVCKMFQRSKNKVYEDVKDGKLEYVQISERGIRFTEEQLNQFITNNTIKPEKKGGRPTNLTGLKPSTIGRRVD